MKIGRNSLCPCGSGKKYKRCCLERQSPMAIPERIRLEIAGAQRREAERIEKYGYVKAPIWTRHAGQTVVAVGSRILYHPKWKTFHDFLFCYIGAVFEKDWFASEKSKPLEERHPLMQWYQIWFDFWASHRTDVPLGAINKVEAPPAQVSALLSFAYDLYTLEQHSLLSKRLVDRLQRKEHFQGARYETYVAAALVRAGFTITPEDEDDFSSTHCELTAIHRQTGKKYAVEAKSRHRTGHLGHAGRPKPLEEIEADITGLFVPALRKSAKHDRIVFIDINVPPSESSILESDWFNKLGSQVNRFERNPQTKDLPGAIVFFTNFPYHFIENGDPLHGSSVAFTGFNIPEFHVPSGGNASLVSAKFPEVLALHDSVLRHTQVPHELS
jgi:hypothetical protein